MTEITNQESGSSVRTKLNQALAKTDLLLTDGVKLEATSDFAFRGSIVERNYTFPALVATDTTPVNINPSNGTHQKITISRAVTFTTSIEDGENVTLIMHNTGSPEPHTVTWFTVTWVTDLGEPPNVEVHDAVTFWRFGTTIYAAHIGGWA